MAVLLSVAGVSLMAVLREVDFFIELIQKIDLKSCD
jgi:hypothetical protein